MDELTSASGIVALSAGFLALVALVVSLIALRRTRALRRAQTVVLGEDGERDIVGHGNELQRQVDGLAHELEKAVGRLEATDADFDTRLDGAVTHCAVIRYDAMGEMTGRQSSSVALLDSHRTGVIFSSILHREHARFYAKQVVEGNSEFDLSPEESEALTTALAARQVS